MSKLEGLQPTQMLCAERVIGALHTHHLCALFTCHARHRHAKTVEAGNASECGVVVQCGAMCTSMKQSASVRSALTPATLEAAHRESGGLQAGMCIAVV